MSFQDKLKSNQMRHAETALLQTIFQDPGQTIGDIWDALEADAESEAMWEMFKALPIGKLVTAAASYVDNLTPKAEPSASASKKGKGKVKPPKVEEEEDEEDVEFEDDDEDEFEDEDDDEEEDDDEDDDEEEEAKKPKSKKKGKGKATSSKKGKSEPDALDLSAPEAQKAYQHAIIKCLKANKARDEGSAVRSTPIREQIGGDAKQFRDQVNLLIEAERVAFAGKARGTKYWLT